MHAAALLLAASLPTAALAETVLASYIFHRHGDRTAKKTPPAALTNLGFNQVFQSGQYFNDRYVAADSAHHIAGLSSDVVRLSQLSVSAPADAVLQNSANGFLQALYPPTGTTGSQTLRNGTAVESPNNGAQLIPISLVASNAGSEDSTWLQDATGCANAQTSSNQYYYSPQYNAYLNSTMSFFQSLYPVVNRTFAQSDMSFKNAYSIFDLINVANIHNTSIQSSDLLSPSSLTQLQYLANVHEFGLAYNASSTIRAISGMQLAAEVIQFLNQSIADQGREKLGIQFGAYGTFTSLFGLMGLPGVDGARFYGIPDYASNMVFELYTDASNATVFPARDALNVRFLFHNGSSDAMIAPQVYPLFGTGRDNLTWTDFSSRMSQFAVGNTQQWCMVCGNTTGTCAQYSGAASANGSSGSTATASEGSGSGSGNGVTPAIGGVIGAMVTLGVVMLVEAAVLLLGGLRLVKKPAPGVAKSA